MHISRRHLGVNNTNDNNDRLVPDEENGSEMNDTSRNHSNDFSVISSQSTPIEMRYSGAPGKMVVIPSQKKDRRKLLKHVDRSTGLLADRSQNLSSITTMIDSDAFNE